MDSCYLPFSIFTAAGFPVTGGPPPRPTRPQRLLVLSGSHRRRTQRLQSARLHTVFASGSFTRRLNAPDSLGDEDGPEGR